MRTNRQLLLRERPTLSVDNSHFNMIETPLLELAAGEALVRVVWLGIDPTQRTWLNPSATYTEPVSLGGLMRGSGVGRVVASRSAKLRTGDWVFGETGWQDYAIARDEGLFGLNRVPDGIDPKMMLSIFGVNGLTAYFGMLDIGKPRSDQTVFVTGAAGSVGSIAGQIAKIQGAQVIGSAGSASKCEWVQSVAGFDHCFNYKDADFDARLRNAAPDGIDLVFDNVGGSVLESALECLSIGSVVVLCGSISSGYGQNSYGSAPKNYMQLAFKRARMEGFIFLDYVDRFPRALADLSQWLKDDRIRYRENIFVGLENAPLTLQGLFDGQNQGKPLVQLCTPEKLDHVERKESDDLRFVGFLQWQA